MRTLWVCILAVSAATASAAWTPNTLEIHHINIGQGDATLVVSPTGETMLVDAGESYWNSHIDADTMGRYIEAVTGSKHLDYVIMTHFQGDHVGYIGYGGLWNLVEVQGFTVGTTLHRDYGTFVGDVTGTLTQWTNFLSSDGGAKLSAEIARLGTSQINLGGGVVVDVKVVDGGGSIRAGDFSRDSTPPSENDYAIGLVIRFGRFDEWVGGDLSGEFLVEYLPGAYGYRYHDIETVAAPFVGDVDVYRVNHHGSNHSSNATFVGQLDPEVSIISVGENTYGHPRQATMDRLLATSDVYLTGRGADSTDIHNAVVAGHIVIRTTDGLTYTVNAVSYTAQDPARTDRDGDRYFAEVDPDDNDPDVIPLPNGGWDPEYQIRNPAHTLPPVMLKTNRINMLSRGAANVYDLCGRNLRLVSRDIRICNGKFVLQAGRGTGRFALIRK